MTPFVRRLLHRKTVFADESGLDYFHPCDHSPDELEEFLGQTPYLLNGTRFAATLFEQGFYVPFLNLPT